MATIEAKLGQDFAVVSTNSFATDAEREPWAFTKSGWLSGQALGLGYVESAEGFTLAGGHGQFTVEGHGEVKAFESFNQARKHFVKAVKARLREELAEA